MKYFTRFMKIAIPVIIIILFILPAGRELIFKIAGLFSSIDPEPIKDFIRSFGTLAALIYLLRSMFKEKPETLETLSFIEED